MERLIERIVREYLLETNKYPKQKGTEVYDGMMYRIVSTYHQWFERHGDDSLLKHIEILETKGYGYRIGATDSILVPTIKNNIGKILESFKLNKPCSTSSADLGFLAKTEKTGGICLMYELTFLSKYNIFSKSKWVVS